MDAFSSSSFLLVTSIGFQYFSTVKNVNQVFSSSFFLILTHYIRLSCLYLIMQSCVYVCVYTFLFSLTAVPGKIYISTQWNKIWTHARITYCKETKSDRCSGKDICTDDNIYSIFETCSICLFNRLIKCQRMKSFPFDKTR